LGAAATSLLLLLPDVDLPSLFSCKKRAVLQFNRNVVQQLTLLESLEVPLAAASLPPPGGDLALPLTLADVVFPSALSCCE
jgi:hypothetical protein